MGKFPPSHAAAAHPLANRGIRLKVSPKDTSGFQKQVWGIQMPPSVGSRGDTGGLSNHP